MVNQREAEIQHQVETILNVHAKFIQAYNLRATLMEKRTFALNAFNKRLEKNSQVETVLNQDEIKALSYCNRNEVRLMDVFISARANTLALLNLDKRINKDDFKMWDTTIRKTYDNKITLATLQGLYSKYSSIVEMFYKNINVVLERIALEKNIIKNPTSNNPVFADYTLKIEKELEMQNEAEILIDSLGRKEILKKLGINYSPEMAGITAGAIFFRVMHTNAVAVATAKSLGPVKELPPSLFVIAWICATIAVLGFGTFMTLRKPGLIYNLTKNLKRMK